MFRLTSQRRLAESILADAAQLRDLSAADLLRRSREAAWRSRGGVPFRTLLPEVFALGIEASRRALGLTHFPVQVEGGIAIFSGRIAEMQTGEGKTLAAVLPAALRAMAGRGCHVLTANEYLAQRDADALRPVYAHLGLSTGCVRDGLDDAARRAAYTCDITYGTASEVGFDFLRDRIKSGAAMEESVALGALAASSNCVQRGHYFALVDEADSILIDEASTPLIIGSESPNQAAMTSLYQWAARIAPELSFRGDFLVEPKRRQAHLTDAGSRKVTLLSKPIVLDSIDTERIYLHVEKALTALYAFTRDKDYVVVDDEVGIVDEGTGRLMDGRKWQDGLHQSIEAKEQVPITPATSSAARITIQSLFRRYEHLGGMTGTAAASRFELKHVYGLKVTVIPTHRPCIRHGQPTRVFISLETKRRAVLAEVERLLDGGRAVLIGTPSVEASEGLSASLSAAGIEHQVLNARQHAIEAEIVARAGQTRTVTIATNMAGRGTDILLSDDVRTAGGLHVLATEMHTSARIDRQLIGRAARQGDPGSYQFLLSLEDELLRSVPPETRQQWIDAARPDANGELPARTLRLFQREQRNLERLHLKHRKQLLKFEREQLNRYRRMGLDPYLEAVAE